MSVNLPAKTSPWFYGMQLPRNQIDPGLSMAIGSALSSMQTGAKAPTTTTKAGSTVTRLYGPRQSWTPVQSFGIIGTGSNNSPTFSRPAMSTPTVFNSGVGRQAGVNSSLDNLSRILGRYTDSATGEMRNKQQGAESLLRSQIAKIENDPQWQFARTAAMQAAQNPGIDPALLAQMRGRAAASAAAATAAGARSVMAQLARGNIRGGGAANALLMNQNRGEVARQQQNVDIDKWAAENKQADKSRSLANLAAILSGQQAPITGLTGQLAGTMTNYNPLAWLQQINQIMSPLGAAGQGMGLTGRATV